MTDRYYYGKSPMFLERVKLELDEYMYVQYMPIKMPGSDFMIPPNMGFLYSILGEMLCDDIQTHKFGNYIYATVKHMFVGKGCAANRMGWHSDGFGTDDINYIWYDKTPTEFCVQKFELSDDHETSLIQMQLQAKEENIFTCDVERLIRLDQSVIHRVAETKEDGFRKFVKISVSKHQYNLKGNAHNYLFDYDWKMVERSVVRNHPIANNGDFYKV